jgi:heavy metal sensor kinase
VSRLPIRIRLSLAFAFAMAVIVALVGGLLYVRLGDSLLEQLDDSLRARAQTLVALVDGDVASRQLRVEEGIAQVLGPGATVVSYPAGSPVLLSEAERTSALRRPFFLRRGSAPGLEDGPARLYATALGGDEGRVLVVGASLDDREEALGGLLSQLLVVGPVALLLTSLVGYALAGAALRPVEAMRARAAEVSTERPGTRLPLPRARDEIHRLGETLNDMLARLEAGLERERRFVADASHELRTPLAALRTELELALRRPRSPQELEEAVRSAGEEVERLSRLADDLLVLARADEGRLPLRPTPVDARDLLEGVARRFEGRAALAGRSLAVSAPNGQVVSGDRVRLEQALGNLVDNSLRHGGGTVELGAESVNGVVALRVADQGPGFPPAFLPHAFERFRRADEARAGGGTGLGLAIVDAIARVHGGSVAAANRDYGGAEVTLRLHVADGSA